MEKIEPYVTVSPDRYVLKLPAGAFSRDEIVTGSVSGLGGGSNCLIVA